METAFFIDFQLFDFSSNIIRSFGDLRKNVTKCGSQFSMRYSPFYKVQHADSHNIFCFSA